MTPHHACRPYIPITLILGRTTPLTGASYLTGAFAVIFQCSRDDVNVVIVKQGQKDQGRRKQEMWGNKHERNIMRGETVQDLQAKSGPGPKWRQYTLSTYCLHHGMQTIPPYIRNTIV